MPTTQAIQKDLQCRNCGGQNRYQPAQQCLVCDSCGTKTRLESADDRKARAEFVYNPGRLDLDLKTPDDKAYHQCQNCGAEVAFVGRALSENCAYCNGPVVLRRGDPAFATMALIPFRVPDKDAIGYIARWLHRRIAAPSDLGTFASKGRMVGLYVPFWTFDSEELVSYYASYEVRVGKQTTRRLTRGKMRISFDDLLVPASPHVTPLIRDGILHEFDPRRLRPYRAGYLAGFGAEQHHQSVTEGLKANEADKDLLIRNKIKQHVGKPSTDVLDYRTDTSGIHYRRILLPVWILHYDYRGKAKKVVVCGIEGRTYGERPFSIWKLAGYSLALTLATVAFGWWWGASGLL